MNQLNSILLEGTLTIDPITTGFPEQNENSCLFHIESNRAEKVNDRTMNVKSLFSVMANEKLSENCVNNLSLGRGVRVVGRLKTRIDEDHKEIPEVYIMAEHIEFKPTIKK